ncbi:PREDICTED: uncharacterized protein LOC109213721 [Nicotiana attenuata]|uniref:uncharacterized protein LOC109213721 n=1 Tax=Nicotiana attenuata TaxID=49451 RepID=UPI0009046A83|nr:PREDICTED: uncharacterized protein LOC109213721 [Nicotiana attenuata]
MTSLWENLKEVAHGINIPWLVIDDFNVVMAPQDRMIGNPVTYAETKDYADCMQGLMLNKLQWKGDYYTWTNKQLGTDRIYSRIDRTFGDHEWMMQWGNLLVEYDVPLISDLSPMVLALAHLKQNIKMPFRFFNVWAKHDSFLPLVEQIWRNNMTDNKMKDIWLKIKALSPLLKQLNNEEFKYISQKIKKTRAELISTQKQISNKCSDELAKMERQQLHNLEKWSMIEEQAMQQKSQAHWIRLGDSNTKYFTVIVK